MSNNQKIKADALMSEAMEAIETKMAAKGRTSADAPRDKLTDKLAMLVLSNVGTVSKVETAKGYVVEFLEDYYSATEADDKADDIDAWLDDIDATEDATETTEAATEAATVELETLRPCIPKLFAPWKGSMVMVAASWHAYDTPEGDTEADPYVRSAIGEVRSNGRVCGPDGWMRLAPTDTHPAVMFVTAAGVESDWHIVCRKDGYQWISPIVGDTSDHDGEAHPWPVMAPRSKESEGARYRVAAHTADGTIRQK